MHSVGDQRQRVCGVAENKLGADDQSVERHTDGKRKPEIVRRMTVPGMTVPGIAVPGMAVSGMIVGMRMVVMIVVMGHGAHDNHCGVSPVRLKRLCARGKSNTITAVPQMAADNGV